MHYESRKYRTLVEWIAFNDNPAHMLTVEELAESLTVTMVAHCYNLKRTAVAEDVLAMRHAGEVRP